LMTYGKVGKQEVENAVKEIYKMVYNV